MFPRDGSDAILVTDKPVGIVYHTSESDIDPLEPDNTNSLLRNTRGLLRWLRKHGNYHYLIDRFGRIYRLVDESDEAYHAGKSIWADDDNYYLDLNDSFIGIFPTIDDAVEEGLATIETADPPPAGEVALKLPGGHVFELSH